MFPEKPSRQQAFPEKPSLLNRLANDYLGGHLTLSQLQGAIQAMLQQALLSGSDPTGRLQSWARMIDRHLDEWRVEKEPLSEAQFSAWLQDQIASGQGDS